jgi:hypothetical protein
LWFNSIEVDPGHCHGRDTRMYGAGARLVAATFSFLTDLTHLDLS